MASEVGVGYISLVPSAKGFGPAAAAAIQKPAAAAGVTAGKELGGGLQTGLTGVLRGVGPKLVAGLGIAAVGKAAFDASRNFETAFAGVRKTVDATEAEFGRLRSGIIGMANAIPASREEIAGVAAAAGQLGIATPNILGFTRVMIDLGNSTNLSAEQAATALARLANITQLPQDQFDRLGSTIVALGNNLATTESEIVDMALRIAGAGKQVGLTESQILSFAAALSSVGVEADAGGSAISRTFIKIANDVKSGGAGLQAFAHVAGTTTEKFKRQFERDAAGATIAFVRGLQRISEEGGNVFATLDELGLGEIRVRDALLRAAGAGDLFNESLRIGSKAWKDNNALTNEAARRYETFDSKLTVFQNRLTNVARVAGEALLPSLGSLLSVTGSFLTVAAKFDDVLVAGTLGLSGFFAASKLGVPIMGSLNTGIQALGQRLLDLGVSAQSASIQGLASFANGMVRIQGALPGIAAAGLTAALTFDKIGQSAGQTAIGIGSLATTGFLLGNAVLPGIGGAAGAAIGGLIGFAKAAFSAGESAEDARKRIAALGTEIESLGARRAAARFLDNLGESAGSLQSTFRTAGESAAQFSRRVGVDLGTARLEVQAARAELSRFTERFRRDFDELARTNPAAAQRVVDGIRLMRNEAGKPILPESVTADLEKRLGRGSDAFQRAAENARAANDANNELRTGTDNAATGFDNVADSAETAADALADFQSTALAAVGGEVGLEQAALNVEKAQSRLNEAVAKSGPFSQEAHDAYLELRSAQLNAANAALSLEEAGASLNEQIGNSPALLQQEIAKLEEMQRKHPEVAASFDPILQRLRDMKTFIDNIPPEKNITIRINTETNTQNLGLGLSDLFNPDGSIRGAAGGGTFTGPGFLRVGERGEELIGIHDNGAVQVFDNKTTRAMTDKTTATVAGGGITFQVGQIVAADVDAAQRDLVRATKTELFLAGLDAGR